MGQREVTVQVRVSVAGKMFAARCDTLLLHAVYERSRQPRDKVGVGTKTAVPDDRIRWIAVNVEDRRAQPENGRIVPLGDSKRGEQK